MSEPYLSEIRIMPFNFAPKGWAFCNGQLLPINQNQALFSLLGTTYGGDGRVNFGLAALQGRIPMHMRNSHMLGERAGEQNHLLTIQKIPSHTHQPNASNVAGSSNLPATELLGNASPNMLYGAVQDTTALRSTVVASVGGSQAHLNMQPFLTLSFCIALQGIFPSQN